MANLTDADKVLRNDTGKDIVTKLNAIKTAIENSGGGGSSTFEGLSDVDIDDQTLTNGQVPKYNSTSQKWENGNVSLVGNLDDLSDVDTTGKASGDSLRYDGAEWIAQPTTVALTQAEYDALQLSGDLVPNTHYVITDAPNLNPTASDIEYSSGVTVADKLDELDTDTATISGTATAQTNITIGSKNLCYKQGIFAYICLVLTTTANISAGDNLVKLPFEINTNQYLYARKEDGTMIVLTGNGEYIKTEFAIANGTILRIGTTTLAT